MLPTIGYIGRYALKYKIGEGGLGVVYAAHDALLSRLIAIKTLNVDLPAQDREQFNALFMNEAKAAGSLNNPHIVTVYDAGVSPQGTYIAMELLRGKDLRQLLALGWRPTPAQCALIVRRVADALSYAHYKGVIHRDIKPANIFMVGRTQPCVLDFGIARIRQAESLNRDDEQSRFQEIVGGSPYYMAPEQVRHEAVDRRADVYSLGVVLYELLTARRPFTGNSLDEIADAVLKGEVRPACEVNPEVPKVLSDIAEQAMARDLTQRTRSARALSKALRDWLRDQGDVPQSGRSQSVRSLMDRNQGAKAPRRWTWPLATVGGLAALAVVGGVVWRGRSGGVPPAESASTVAAAVMTQAASPPIVVAPALVAAPVLAAAPSVAPSASGPDPLPEAAAPAIAAQENPVANDAAPASTGVVNLAISPWGEVFEGRRSLGVTPPLTQLNLPVGRHTLTIRNGDAPPLRKTVTVKAGVAVTIKHQF
ncbi:MAG: serine/threonine protein kinase [Burkholderiales bacterium]|nr:serine/threonine protein kinase [Burkholderiales bacterium]